MIRFRSFPFELVFWVSALVMLAAADPHAHHFSLCPLAILGADWCPGCGLGRSIAALFQGDLAASLRFHWFGIPALGFIGYRIYELVRKSVHTQLKTIRRTHHV